MSKKKQLTKQEKIDYINSIKEKYENAKNHGNGGDWWYPKSNVIAYDVKLHGASKDIDDLRAILSQRQNDYYSDNTLYEIMSDMQCDDAQFFRDDICNEYSVVNAGYAGRSDGWLEVEYSADFDYIEDDTATSDINEAYKQAIALETLENDVSTFIAEALKKYKQYINSDEYIADILEHLQSDEDIATIYKSKIQQYADKLL